MTLLGMIWNAFKGFIRYRILHADDPPRRIALGVAMAFAIAWTPAIGLQTACYVLLAWVLRANIAVGIPVMWISNPATLAIIYYPNYMLGNWLLGRGGSGGEFLSAIKLTGGFSERIQQWWMVTAQFAAPLWVGSVLAAIFVGAVMYVVTYWGVTAYRRRKPYLELQVSKRRKGERADDQEPRDGNQPRED
jgi:hypothetical protein